MQQAAPSAIGERVAHPCGRPRFRRGLLRIPQIGLGPRAVELSARHARAERQAMLALVAVFVLLVQMLAPAFAVAGPAMDGAICTTMGLQAAPDDGAPAPPDHDCKHCLCPAPTSEPPKTAQVVRIAYVEALAPVVETPRGLRPPTRAPPRPPGQGPPLPNV